jgi:hypothetical protein
MADDPLMAQLEAEGRKARTASKATRRFERRSGERRAVTVGGRRSKRAGYNAEKRIEAMLADYGFQRVPMSGALGGRLSGDLRRDMADFLPRSIVMAEVKRRRGQQTQLRRWVEQSGSTLLVLDTGEGAEPLCVMLMEQFKRLLAGAGYETKVNGVP